MTCSTASAPREDRVAREDHEARYQRRGLEQARHQHDTIEAVGRALLDRLAGEAHALRPLAGLGAALLLGDQVAPVCGVGRGDVEQLLRVCAGFHLLLRHPEHLLGRLRPEHAGAHD